MSGIPGPEILARPVSPDAAIAFWKQRAKLTWPEAKALEDGVRHRAFYVTGLAERDLVQTVNNGIQSALENGDTLAGFKKNILGVIESEGWKGQRIENIFRTNVQTAYSAGRYTKMQAVKEARPYWQYVTVEDKRRRPSHAILHGVVYPADHEFWGTNYPPNGFRCRCTVRTLSDRQIKAQGLTVQKDMPGDSMYTDPKTGMEYHVAKPGADPGFDNNPGKDWLAGLDLKKYPDLTPKSYGEQRGPDSKRPAPVKTDAELCAAIKERCSEFATNAGIKRIELNTEKYFMATNHFGWFYMSKRTFKTGSSSEFNPVGALKNAWNKLSQGKTLDWNEEYSLESLWHEITHNRQLVGRIPKGSSKECVMEVVTQWTARRTYPELLESLGGKAAHQEDIIKNGLGYGGYLKRFDRLLDVLKVRDEELLPELLWLIQSREIQEYMEAVAELLQDFSGAKKSAINRALSNLNKFQVDYEALLRTCGLTD